MPQSSLVLELQCLAQSNKTDLSELLRHAKVVAVKLKLDDFKEWLDREMGGYPRDGKVPEYRILSAQLMAKNPYNGLIPIMFKAGDKRATHFSKSPIVQSVGELEHLLHGMQQDGQLQIPLSSSEMEWLVDGNRDLMHMPPTRIVSPSGVAGILHAVRDTILNWALDLERRGILGEGMTFTQDERRSAANMTIHNYGAFIHGDNANMASADASPGATVTTAAGGAQVHQRLRTVIAAAQQQNEELGSALQALADAVVKSRDLPDEKKSEATEQLSFVAQQCALPEDKRQPRSVLKPLLSGLRETLGLSADVLQVWGVYGPTILAVLGVALS
ncbi:hypothetical protein [Corallococcus sp. CA049B]|uniref:AbiTii domain-containing protein n=1 Tax=Corallococcus sp. CA049B TaxID=2316730 RepID=UPI0011C362C5|nr:hypothetical protein [Corallococcus sp. CA049B]